MEAAHFTTDLFVSYARIDDTDGSARKFVERLAQAVHKYTGHSIEIFMDFEAIQEGEPWRQRILSELQTSRLMLALVSPSFFRSPWCLQEWDAFFERTRNIVSGAHPLLPVELVPLADPKMDFQVEDDLTPEQRQRLQQARSLQMPTWWKDRYDEDKADRLLRRMAHAIRNRIRSMGDVHQVSNTHVIDLAIDRHAKAKTCRRLYPKIESQQRAYEKLLPVCVIYTGGTVGMVREDPTNLDSVPTIGRVQSLVSRIPKLHELKFDLDFYSYEAPIDSANIDSDDWCNLANIIRDLYRFYQGFVVLHGTNTMSYTASALSFLFQRLTKPVVVTGAEIPPFELHSDAEANVLRAAEVAAPDAPGSPGKVPEVSILMGNLLLRGNRSKKWHSQDTTGFFSPNYSPLGAITNKTVNLNHREIRREPTTSGDEDLMVGSLIARSGIAIMEVYPDMNLEYFSPVLEDPSLRGVVLRTYGAGNAPEVPREFLDSLKDAVERGVVVVNLTQCPTGYVELSLFETTARLFDIGVIYGGDMTTEAAYCKLKYLLGRVKNGDRSGLDLVKRQMQVDLRGELTFSAYQLKYERSVDVTEGNPIFFGGQKSVSHFEFEPGDIDHAFVRLQGADVSGQEGEEVRFLIYYNRFDLKQTGESLDDHMLIGSFRRSLKDKNRISHNLEVTDRIRRVIRTGDRREQSAALQIQTRDNQEFNFESLQLTIFARS